MWCYIHVVLHFQSISFFLYLWPNWCAWKAYPLSLIDGCYCPPPQRPIQKAAARRGAGQPLLSLFLALCLWCLRRVLWPSLDRVSSGSSTRVCSLLEPLLTCLGEWWKKEEGEREKERERALLCVLSCSLWVLTMLLIECTNKSA